MATEDAAADRMRRGRVLLVDDDTDLCRLLAHGLAAHGLHVVWSSSGEDALVTLRGAEFDVVVADVEMTGMHGIALCKEIAEDRPDVPVVILTSSGNLETAVAAIRAGAYDFIQKPAELPALAIALDRAVQHRRLRAEVRRLRETVEQTDAFDEIIAESPAMKDVVALLARIADADASVLLTGESGTGKELVARALHWRSGRAKGPFVTINCAAIPEALLESELYGHVRGAFTGAGANRPGLFLQAHGGTLLLDEIGEMAPSLQAKLLRTLQERMVRPVGADTETPFDVRLIAATNQDLELAVRERRFRGDLLFRLDVLHVALPPLRERREDILLLAQFFIHRFASRTKKPVVGLSPAAAERLLAYPWPGNVRELQNYIERGVVLARHDRIGLDDLPDRVHRRRERPVPLVDGGGDLVSLVELERRHILRVLDAVHGNRMEAALVLGVDRKTLYRKLLRYAESR